MKIDIVANTDQTFFNFYPELEYVIAPRNTR